jgi:hypothetical protein
MKRWEKIIVSSVVVPLAAFTIYAAIVSYNISRPKKHVYISDSEAQKSFNYRTTFATKKDIDTTIQLIPLEKIVTEITNFSQININTDETRKAFCVDLLREAGYAPVITDDTIYTVKEGTLSDYVVIGAHYDKEPGPSKGILDNMLGCVLVSNIAKVLKDELTNFTYLFLFYGDEENGRKIGSATSIYRSGNDGKPSYVIEIDYVGDKHGSLGGRYSSQESARYLKRGIKINTWPMPKQRTIHTERDNITNVDFHKAYLAYKTVISLIEGIEKGEGLNPPDTVNFLGKDRPIKGAQQTEKDYDE